MLLHPEVATRSCTDCQQFVYDERTGQRTYRDPAKTIPCLRVAGTEPCRTAQGCKKGTPESPKSLNARNRQAWDHYMRCKATGRFPDDSIVAHNAGLIVQVSEAISRARAELYQAMAAYGRQ